MTSTLPNKVRVTTKQALSEALSAGVSVDASVRSETRDTAVTTHRLEQLAFNGCSVEAELLWWCCFPVVGGGAFSSLLLGGAVLSTLFLFGAFGT